MMDSIHRKLVRLGFVVLGVLALGIGWQLGWRDTAEAGKRRQAPSGLAPVDPPRPKAGSESATANDKPAASERRVQDNLTAEQRAERWIQDMETLAAEYHGLQKQLFLEHPELPGLREYIRNRPGELNEGINPLIDELTLHLKDESFAKVWADLRVLRRPDEWLAVLEDPLFAAYFQDVWAHAGIDKPITAWLREGDALAGLEPWPADRVLSFAELRRVLESRRVRYQETAERLAQQAQVPSRLLQILEPTEYFKVQVAEWYVESFYAGRLQQIRREMNRLADELGQLANGYQNEAMKMLMQRAASIHFPDIGKR
jgi:hypothetical protein